jgi:GH24 family phage-related lysozyme (muramidase)
MSYKLLAGSHITKDKSGDITVNIDKPLVTISGKKWNSPGQMGHDIYDAVYKTFAELYKEVKDFAEEATHPKDAAHGRSNLLIPTGKEDAQHHRTYKINPYAGNSIHSKLNKAIGSDGFLTVGNYVKRIVEETKRRNTAKKVVSKNGENRAKNKAKPAPVLSTQKTASKKDVGTQPAPEYYNPDDDNTGEGGFGAYDKQHLRRFIFEPEADNGAYSDAADGQNTTAATNANPLPPPPPQADKKTPPVTNTTTSGQKTAKTGGGGTTKKIPKKRTTKKTTKAQKTDKKTRDGTKKDVAVKKDTKAQRTPPSIKSTKKDAASKKTSKAQNVPPVTKNTNTGIAPDKLQTNNGSAQEQKNDLKIQPVHMDYQPYINQPDKASKAPTYYSYNFNLDEVNKSVVKVTSTSTSTKNTIDTSQTIAKQDSVSKKEVTGKDNLTKEDPKMMTMTQEGINWMMKEEGAPILNEPKNVQGDATIGYGHLIHKGKVTKADTDKYKKMKYSQSDAENDYKKDLSDKGVAPVQKDVKVKLAQNQFEALVDFSYNSGRTNLYNSELLTAINKSETNPELITPEKIREYFNIYKRKAPNRKADEATLFNTGKYVVTRTPTKKSTRKKDRGTKNTGKKVTKHKK